MIFLITQYLVRSGNLLEFILGVSRWNLHKEEEIMKLQGLKKKSKEKKAEKSCFGKLVHPA